MSSGHPTLGAYYRVFAALMGLTALTVLVAYQDLGAFNTVVALTIAVAKGVLVVLYFMHVRYSSRLVWVVAAAGFVWLILLIGFTMADFLTRAAGEVRVLG